MSQEPQTQQRGRSLTGLRRAALPLLALATILLVNYLMSPRFFNVRVVDGHFYGSLIDVLNRAAPVMLLAIGMTLVIATGGIDLSVGAVIAISGAVAAVLVNMGIPVPLVLLAAVAVGTLCGLWNGFLVAFLDLQPIIATLILMVVGRGIAQLITQGQIVTFTNEALSFWGSGYILGFPVAMWVALVALAVVYLFVRRTALGLFLESIGANARASFYTGINARLITLLVYVISGTCAGIAGIIITADIDGADANNAGLWLELDAILAVVIGGTALTGGRFYLFLSVVGALIIQSINAGILVGGFPVEYNQIVKAVVILVVLLVQSPRFQRALSARRGGTA